MYEDVVAYIEYALQSLEYILDYVLEDFGSTGDTKIEAGVAPEASAWVENIVME